MKRLPQLDGFLCKATAQTDGDRLTVSTGRVRRAWEWTGRGFSTVGVSAESGPSWSGEAGKCDWQLPCGAEATSADLLSLSVVPSDDEGFTSEHLCVVAEIAYPEAGVVLRWTVWAYPGASGLRTQLAARRLAGQAASGRPVEARVDRVPVGDPRLRRRMIGYFNDTQRRNDTHLDILKEEAVARPLAGTEWCEWASIACVEDDAGGMALVKESHKCVNQRGHETGGFVFDEAEGLSCTGWGLTSDEISGDEFTAGWATWWLAWSGGDLERELALKTFDRLRYPVDPRRDIYVQANTWGSTENSQDGRRAATEKSVLQEIESCAELGIDILQIDDGWQVPPGHSTWKPGENGWRPHPESYPAGWRAVRDRAGQAGVKLGLWAAALPVGPDELRASRAEGGFVQYKLDFANLRSRAEIDGLMNKVRSFVLGTGHAVRVNWDVTENPARYGYFFAREYGCIYLENRKPSRPLSVVYRPHTVLQDLWQVAKYLNLNRFQCSIQNVDRVDPQRSDARLHSHAYAAAIALMGVPLFFQQTRLYSADAKAEIRSLLDEYKKHREAMFRGIVHPVGDKPNNASWTGFQCHLPDESRGYLTVFRERCNTEPEQALRLAWLSEGPVRMSDLRTGERLGQAVAADGSVAFRIDRAPGFLFLEYSQADAVRSAAGPPAPSIE